MPVPHTCINQAPVYSGPSAADIAAQQAAQQAAQRAAQQEAQRQARIRETRAANDAGLAFWKRHEWGAAVEKFRQALAKSPDSKVIRDNLNQATEQLRQQQAEETRKQADSNTASQMSATLKQLTAGIPDFDGRTAGSAAASSDAGLDFMPVGDASTRSAAQSKGAPAQAATWQDPNVVDLRGTTKTSVDPAVVKGSATAATTGDAGGLTFMQIDSVTSGGQNPGPSGDAGAVDLRGATRTSVDPAAMKGVASNKSVASNHPAPPPPPPPNPAVQKPQDKDVELLMQPLMDNNSPAPKSTWPGPQRPANEPKLVNPLNREDPNLRKPQDKDLELLMDPLLGSNSSATQNSDLELLMAPLLDPNRQVPKSAWPGPQRPANEPKLINPLDNEPKSAWPGQHRPASKPKLVNPLDKEQATTTTPAEPHN